MERFLTYWLALNLERETLRLDSAKFRLGSLFFLKTLELALLEGEEEDSLDLPLLRLLCFVFFFFFDECLRDPLVSFNSLAIFSSFWKMGSLANRS